MIVLRYPFGQCRCHVESCRGRGVGALPRSIFGEVEKVGRTVITESDSVARTAIL